MVGASLAASSGDKSALGLVVLGPSADRTGNSGKEGLDGVTATGVSVGGAMTVRGVSMATASGASCGGSVKLAERGIMAVGVSRGVRPSGRLWLRLRRAAFMRLSAVFARLFVAVLPVTQLVESSLAILRVS